MIDNNNILNAYLNMSRFETPHFPYIDVIISLFCMPIVSLIFPLKLICTKPPIQKVIDKIAFLFGFETAIGKMSFR